MLPVSQIKYYLVLTVHIRICNCFSHINFNDIDLKQNLQLPFSFPDITVIIPTSNRAHTLSRALDSVFVQTLQPHEVIVVDDGSKDHTEMILKRYPALRVIRQQNLGVSAARNKGISQAESDWIALLDSDDEWLPNKLEKQWFALVEKKALFCHTDEIWVRNGIRVNPMKKHQKHGGMIYKKCLPFCVISPSSSLFHNSVLKDVGMFDETLEVGEDYDLWLRICSKYPILYIPEKLII